MAIAETAQLAVLLTLKDEMSAGMARAEASLAGLNRTAATSGLAVAKTGGVMAGVKVAAVGMAGGLNHAKNAIGGLLTGPLGVLGLGAGIFSLGGAIMSSVKKIEDFGASLEKVQTLTGETAQQSGALILTFNKFLDMDKAAQIIGFTEKTLGKLNTTMAASGKNAKSAALQTLEAEKLRLQASGSSVTIVNKLISEQKARDALTASATGNMTKLTALDTQFGLHLVDAKGKVASFSDTLSQMAAFYDSNASASTKAYVASLVFGRGYSMMIPILNEGSAGLRQAAAEAASLGLGSADTVKQLATFHDQMHALGESVDVLQLSIGTALLPTLIDLSKGANDFIQKNQKPIVQFFKDATKFAGTLGDALRPIVGIFSGIVSGFNNLPSDLKAILVGTFVANKATSMIFGSSLKGIAEGAFNAYKAMRGSSPASPMYVADVTGGGLTSKLGGIISGAVAFLPAAIGFAIAGYLFTNVLKPQTEANNAAAAQLPKTTAEFIKTATTKQLQDALAATKEQGANPIFGIGSLIPGFGELTGSKAAMLGIQATEQALQDELRRRLPIDERTEQSASAAARAMQRVSDHADALTGTLDDLRKGTHAYLDELIGKKGGAFQRAGEAGGVKAYEAAAGKVFQLFDTSTSPSLKSMQDNLRIMQDWQTTHPTDTVVGGYIKGLQTLIETGLANIATAITSMGGYAGSGIAYPLQPPGKPGAYTGRGAKASGGKDDLVSIHIANPVSPLAVTKASAVINRASGQRTLSGNIVTAY